MKRGFDISFGLVLVAVFAVPMVLIALAVKLTSRGPAIYWSERVGKNGVHFKMPKFRSMRVATNDGQPREGTLTAVGPFIRSTSLDELPQLYSIVKGDMSFVGPRPLVPHEADIITLRAHHGVDQMLPGLTGWAQINGRDELSVAEKVALDAEYQRRCSFWFDLKILGITAVKVIRREGVLADG